ncbi:MAG TPA: ester cyclase [Dehalococcoidia bacterium]|jgi:predicted ester cyclase|nr:ester cyclase [Dehalococcoidia bacterium]
MSRTGLPDFHSTIEDRIVEGDKVMTRFTVRGTQQGELMGIALTGRQVTLTGIAIHRISGGKIVENWLSMDMLGMLQQLGVVPPPGQLST